MQLNLETAIWEKRDPVGAHSMASARLAVFQQQIFCAYTTDVAGTIEVQRWDRRLAASISYPYTEIIFVLEACAFIGQLSSI
jgi:hypothetical protein